MTKSILALTVLAAATLAHGATRTYDFKDPKGGNNAVFKLDAPLEAINGTASGISGTIDFDPEKPEALKGVIVVDAASLRVPNPMMQEHMHGEQWMDVKQHPQIRFEASRVANVKRDGTKVTADVTGMMTLRGVSRELTVPVSFTHLPGKLGARSNGRMEGDLLVVRATFTVRRAGYGINPSAPTDKVAEEIELTLSLAGAAPNS